MTHRDFIAKEITSGPCQKAFTLYSGTAIAMLASREVSSARVIGTS